MRFPEIDTLLVHIPKTGGTTISLAIGKHLYPDEFRDGKDGVISMYNNPDRRVVERRERKAHVYASTYKKALGKKLYDSQYSFAFVRNPFEQIKSLFAQLTYMNIEQNPKFIPYKTMSFEKFVMGSGSHSMIGNDNLIDQTKYVCNPKTGNIMVNDVFPFEYYKDSIKIIGEKVGIFINPNIVMRKTKNHSDCYTPEMASKVIDIYGHVYDLYNKVKKDFEINVLSRK